MLYSRGVNEMNITCLSFQYPNLGGLPFDQVCEKGPRRLSGDVFRSSIQIWEVCPSIKFVQRVLADFAVMSFVPISPIWKTLGEKDPGVCTRISDRDSDRIWANWPLNSYQKFGHLGPTGAQPRYKFGQMLDFGSRI